MHGSRCISVAVGGLLTVLTAVSVGWTMSDGARYVGAVLDVDRAAGKLVVGDMGPLLAGGNSEVNRRSVQVTPSTEFVKVKRASGTAPSGFVGDFVETKLPAWDVRPGDFVAVTTRSGRSEAVKVTVVDTTEP